MKENDYYVLDTHSVVEHSHESLEVELPDGPLPLLLVAAAVRAALGPAVHAAAAALRDFESFPARLFLDDVKVLEAVGNHLDLEGRKNKDGRMVG